MSYYQQNKKDNLRVLSLIDEKMDELVGSGEYILENYSEDMFEIHFKRIGLGSDESRQCAEDVSEYINNREESNLIKIENWKDMSFCLTYTN